MTRLSSILDDRRFSILHLVFSPHNPYTPRSIVYVGGYNTLLLTSILSLPELRIISNMLLTSLALLVTVTRFAFADVQFTSPDAGATVAGGKAITIKWKESGDKPAISDLLSYSLYLWAGGNEATEQVSIICRASCHDTLGLGVR